MTDIGFANLPDQIHRAAVERGFQFTLMVAGRSGLGKSTFVNCLFGADIYDELPYNAETPRQTEAVTSTRVILRENSVQLALTVVDTPGFGDAIDNTDCWAAVTEYITDAFRAYEESDSKISRSSVDDARVHCCLYFIPPSTHGLTELDLATISHLHSVVNVIPVIAKADTLTEEECAALKQKVRATLQERNIDVFTFPRLDDDDDDDNDDDDDDSAGDDDTWEEGRHAARRGGSSKRLNDQWPFAVCASNQVISGENGSFFGRKYPWGTVAVSDPRLSDFGLLRDLLIRTHLQLLIDTTNDVHYENFRAKHLSHLTRASTSDDASTSSNVLDELERKRSERLSRLAEREMQRKEELRKKFDAKIDKIDKQTTGLQQKHRQFQNEISSRQLRLQQEREQFEREKRDYEQKRQQEKMERFKEAEDKKHKHWFKSKKN